MTAPDVAIVIEHVVLVIATGFDNADVGAYMMMTTATRGSRGETGWRILFYEGV